jgi:hypothetical protein
MTRFCFFVVTGGGGGGAMGLLLVSVLALLSMGLAGFVGELSRVRPSLPLVSDRGTRSLLRLREKVSSNDAVEVDLGMNMDLGRSFWAGRMDGWPMSKKLRCLVGE